LESLSVRQSDSPSKRRTVDLLNPKPALCNNYRWHYLPEEFQYILKLGVWAKYQVEKKTAVGEEIATGFVQHERRRKRRKSTDA